MLRRRSATVTEIFITIHKTYTNLTSLSFRVRLRLLASGKSIKIFKTRHGGFVRISYNLPGGQLRISQTFRNSKKGGKGKDNIQGFFHKNSSACNVKMPSDPSLLQHYRGLSDEITHVAYHPKETQVSIGFDQS